MDRTGRRLNQRALIDARLALGTFTVSGFPDEIMQRLGRPSLAHPPGRWGGAFSASGSVDPQEEMVGGVVAQCRPGAFRLPPVVADFRTSAHPAIDD